MKDLVKIKNGLDGLIKESYLTENKQQTKEIFQQLSENDDLKTLYYCINNLQNPPELNENEIVEFIDENVKLAKTIKDVHFDGLASKLKVELTDLDQNINTVLFENKTIYNFAEYSTAKNRIIESIKEKRRPIDLNLSEYSEEDVQFINKIIENPEPVFQNLCNECLDVLNQKLESENDLNTKLLIYETREKILKSQINFKFSPENVIEILNLKQDLLTD